MSRVMRFFCWLMALAVLLSGMCFEKIKADSILRCPEFSAAREVLEYTTESEPAASAEMEFLPQVTAIHILREMCRKRHLRPSRALPIAAIYIRRCSYIPLAGLGPH